MSSTKSSEDLTNEVKKQTRAVLLSKFGGVPLVQFGKDYSELLGKRFPFRELGFSDLRSCLESLDDTVRFEYSKALQEVMLFGIADDHSFMSSPAIKAQFTPDKPVVKRKRVRNRKNKKSSDSDGTSSQHTSPKTKAVQRRGKQRQNGQSSAEEVQSSELVELRPNLKGLYSICVAKLDRSLETSVQEVFSEVAEPEETSRGGSHFFLRYKTLEEAEQIIARFDEYKLKGTTLAVKPAKEKMAGRDGTRPSTKRTQHSDGTQLEGHKDSKLKTEGRGGRSRNRKPQQNVKANAKADHPRSMHQNKNTKQFPRAGGDIKQEPESADVRLPWQCSKLNGDICKRLEDNPDASLENLRQQYELFSAGGYTDPCVSSERTDSVSDIINRPIPKPRLPSILDLADRFEDGK